MSFPFVYIIIIIIIIIILSTLFFGSIYFNSFYYQPGMLNSLQWSPNPWWFQKYNHITTDMLCICKTFSTPKTHFSNHRNWEMCSKAAFKDRFEAVTFNSHDGSEIIISPLHALAYKSLELNEKLLIVAFRHQEGEGLLDSDMWEAMSLWGRNFIQIRLGNHAQPGTFLSYISKQIQFLFHYIRTDVFHTDYYHLSSLIVDQLKKEYPDHLMFFTGYSMGGAIAQLQAIRINTSAIVFASNGIHDIVHDLYWNELGISYLSYTKINPKIKSIINVFDKMDPTPRMDCQISIVCPLPSICSDNETNSCDPHPHYVYGDVAENNLHHLQLDGFENCFSGREWSTNNGYCIFQKDLKTNYTFKEELR